MKAQQQVEERVSELPQESYNAEHRGKMATVFTGITSRWCAYCTSRIQMENIHWMVMIPGRSKIPFCNENCCSIYQFEEKDTYYERMQDYWFEMGIISKCDMR